MPGHLSRAREGYFAGRGQLLRYRIRENGESVVYSIGRDGEDDQGEELKDWFRIGDFTLSVAPIRSRALPASDSP